MKPDYENMKHLLSDILIQDAKICDFIFDWNLLSQNSIRRRKHNSALNFNTIIKKNKYYFILFRIKPQEKYIIKDDSIQKTSSDDKRKISVKKSKYISTETYKNPKDSNTKLQTQIKNHDTKFTPIVKPNGCCIIV